MNESPINQNDIRDLEELASRNLKARHLSSLLLEAPSPLQRMVIYLVSLLVISAFLFLGFTSIPTLITSRGVLISETPELQILSPGQFAVRKVQIRSGEEVARGDLLIELGPTKPGLTRSSLELQGTQIEKNLREASMAEEFYKNLLEGDRDFKNLQTHSLPPGDLLNTVNQIHNLKSRLKETSEDRLLFHQQKPSAEYDTAVRLENRVQEIENRITLIQSSLKGYYQDLTRQVMTMRSKNPLLKERLETIKAQLNQLNNEGVVKILMPVEGIVSSLKKLSPGQVLQKGEVLASIVPRGSKISCITHLSRLDRLWLSPGNETRILMDAYPSSEFGVISGKIAEIYTESQQNGSFQARITLDPISGEPQTKKMRLYPGLRADLKIHGKETSLFRILFPEEMNFIK